jgi:hypothetical protein
VPEALNNPAAVGGKRTLIKLVAGLVLLAMLVSFSVRYGDVLRMVTVAQVAIATLISIVIILLNGVVGYRTLTLVAGKIALRDVINVTALSSFANALGGLPIGIVYKFHIFRQKSELPASSILTGLVYFTGLNVASLLGIAGLTSPWKVLLVPLLMSWVLPWLPGIRRLPGLAGFNWKTHAGNCLLSLVVSTTMILCYLALMGNHCSDVACYVEQAGVTAVGLSLNFLVNGQSLGGVSELTMGIAGFLHGADLLRGVELAIIIRLSTLLAATCLLGVLKLVYGKSHLL